MKLAIRRIDFLRILTYVGQAIPVKSAEAQFMNFLIDCKADKLSVIASDGIISAKAEQALKNEKGEDVILNIEPGLIQTPAKYLLDIVAKLGGDTVTLSMVDTNFLNISDGSTDFNLITKAGEEYPDVDLVVPTDKKGIAVSLKDIKMLFDATSYAVATRGPKDLFYGINLHAQAGKLYFMATDSYRMARYAVSEADPEAQFTFTCPVKALAMVTNIPTTGNCTIFFDDQRALFVSDGVTLSTRLIRGDFPSADRLIPDTFPYQVSIDTSEFLAAADCVKIMSSAEDKNSQVRLTLSKDNGVTLSAKSTNYGNGTVPLKKSTIVLPETENVFEIGFNVDFATAAVRALNAPKVTFVFVSPTRMFMVKNDDPENIQIITPIRMNSFNE
ncbi:MAG: DNA polymerase III subunit beta [Bacilli bacterium]|jgi:DNA polymerase-3 subunit beta|nr:DNA polymerase III subunit beta [Bacilli bacterium]